MKRKRTDSSVSFEIISQIREAIFNNNIEQLKELIQKIPDINQLFLFDSQKYFAINPNSKIKPSCPCEEYTFLHIAAIYGRATCVELILNIQGVDPNIYSIKPDIESINGGIEHLTPAHAIYYGIEDKSSDHARVMELLLKNGASLDSRANINGTSVKVEDLFENGEPMPQSKSKSKSRLYQFLVPVNKPDALLVNAVLGVIQKHIKKPEPLPR